MNDPAGELLGAFELHAPDQITAILDTGFDSKTLIRGRPAIAHLLEMYTRSDRFPACLRAMLARGATLPDPALAPVLLDDPAALTAAVLAKPALLHHRASLPCTFTPLDGASLLHVAAEYGHLATARRLLELGHPVDPRADLDSHGMNGQTPLFHTVNANANRSEPILRLLLAAGASPELRLSGITWGRGFPWATTCFDVTPISYAQLGLLPQMHRKDTDIYANVHTLLAAAGRAVPPLINIPNSYLRKP
jgi:hypothetical protein